MEIEVISSPTNRTDNRIITPPESEQEFYSIVNHSPHNLSERGFGVWDSMNNIIRENIEYEKDIKTQGFLNFKNRTVPTKLLEQDENVYLFPKEWYNIIPNGFIVTGLYGEEYPFEKGITDDDIRFGCLAYGIRKPI